jgi:HemX protein
VQRLPSLDMIDRFMFRASLIGTPLLTLSLAVAVTSILTEGRYGLLLDPKVLTSFVALALYIANILQYRWFDSPAWKAARFNVISFIVLLFNLLINKVSSFHGWS